MPDARSCPPCFFLFIGSFFSTASINRYSRYLSVPLGTTAPLCRAYGMLPITIRGRTLRGIQTGRFAGMLEITLGYARANGAHYNNIPPALVTRPGNLF